MKRRKLVNTAAIGVAALGALVAGAGSAFASVPTSGEDYTNGIQLLVRPISPFGTVATWCNDRSDSVRIYAGIYDAGTGRDVSMEDIHTGWTTYPTYINFGPGGCESFRLYDYYAPGDNVDVYGSFIAQPTSAGNTVFVSVQAVASGN